MTLPLDAALDYAESGWRVFPVHTIRDGRCSCGNGECGSPGKHPLAAHGFKEATTNSAVIRDWWQKWPDANIAVPTGAASGFFVLDVDPRHGGDRTLEDLEREHGPLPDSVESITGGGGRHIFFAWPDRPVRSRANALGPGLDLRADGGYVLVPPSNHISGQHYQWELSSLPGEVPLAAAPAWVLNGQVTQAAKPAAETVGKPYLNGTRNSSLTSLAGTMRRRGMSESAILAALQEENQGRCRPPLADSVVVGIAHSVSRYEPAEAGADGFALTDLGNSERFIAQHSDALRYCPTRARWLVWVGTHWRWDDTLESERQAQQTIRSIYAEASRIEASEQRKAVAGWAHKSESNRRIVDMLHRARPYVAVSLDALDGDAWLLNTVNGTLDLHTGNLRPHARDDLLTKIAGAAYDPDALCPTWHGFLTRTFADNEGVIGYVQRVLGMALTGDISEQILPVFVGSGANGKSTLLDTVLGVFGDYGTIAPPRLLVTKGHQEHPTQIADLYGRRLVVASETEEGGRLRVQFVKTATGDERLKARWMRGDYFEFRRTHKMVLCTNHLPIIQETLRETIWRRLRVVRFPVTIPEDERDQRLLQRLQAEWPGVLAWLVRGCLAWQKNGLGAPPEVGLDTESYRLDQDPLAEFFADSTLFGESLQVGRGELRSAYERWAETNREKPLSARRLNARLREMGVEDTTGRVAGKPKRLWRGIGLRETTRIDGELYADSSAEPEKSPVPF